jgi:hypothetical protein
MNFKTLAMVGLVGVGIVYAEGESQLRTQLSDKLHKRPVISPTASTGYFCEAYKI